MYFYKLEYLMTVLEQNFAIESWSNKILKTKLLSNTALYFIMARCGLTFLNF